MEKELQYIAICTKKFLFKIKMHVQKKASKLKGHKYHFTYSSKIVTVLTTRRYTISLKNEKNQPVQKIEGKRIFQK